MKDLLGAKQFDLGGYPRWQMSGRKVDLK